MAQRAAIVAVGVSRNLVCFTRGMDDKLSQLMGARAGDDRSTFTNSGLLLVIAKSMPSLAPLLILLMMKSVAYCDTWLVATNGNDAADGLSPGTAKATVQAAVDSASPGDTVMVG